MNPSTTFSFISVAKNDPTAEKNHREIPFPILIMALTSFGRLSNTLLIETQTRDKQARLKKKTFFFVSCFDHFVTKTEAMSGWEFKSQLDRLLNRPRERTNNDEENINRKQNWITVLMNSSGWTNFCARIIKPRKIKKAKAVVVSRSGLPHAAVVG